MLVEDDAELSGAVSASLKREHYALDWVTDGVAAAAALSMADYDLMILDLGLPKLSGLNVLKQLRGRGESQRALPVLVATASRRWMRARTITWPSRSRWTNCMLAFAR